MLLRLHRGYEVLKPRICIYGARCTRAPYGVAPEPKVELKGQAEDDFCLQGVFEKSLPFMTHVLQPPILDLKSLDLGLRFPNRGILCDL